MVNGYWGTVQAEPEEGQAVNGRMDGQVKGGGGFVGDESGGVEIVLGNGRFHRPQHYRNFIRPAGHQHIHRILKCQPLPVCLQNEIICHEKYGVTAVVAGSDGAL